MKKFVGRRPRSHDRQLSTVTPPVQSNVKERLQFKPLLPGKKKPVGENWSRQQSISPLGEVQTDDLVGHGNRAHNMMTKTGMKCSGYDDVNGQEHKAAQLALAHDGMTTDRDALADRATETYNEHLYEEVVDKQTGKRSLLFRNDIFDRI